MTPDTEHADAGRIPTAVWINRPRAGRGRARRAIAGAAIGLALFATAVADGGRAAAPEGVAAARGVFYLPARIAIDPAAAAEAQPPTF